MGRFNSPDLFEFLSLAENQCMTAIGMRIVSLREALGMNQSELARQAKIRQPSLSDIENGVTKSLKGKTLKNLCDVLHTTPSYLLDDRAPVEDVDLPAMESELVFTVRNLHPERRIALLEYARFLLNQQKETPLLLKPTSAKVHPIKAAKQPPRVRRKAAAKPAAKD